MLKVILFALSTLLLAASILAQRQRPAVPRVYPSTGRKAATLKYMQLGGAAAAAAQSGTKPGFDSHTADALKQYCPGIIVLASPKSADYTTLFSSDQWGYELTVIREDGEVVWGGKSHWTKKSIVRKACKHILSDWKEHPTPSNNSPREKGSTDASHEGGADR